MMTSLHRTGRTVAIPFLLSLSLLTACVRPAPGESASSRVSSLAVSAIGMTVADADRSAAFFADVLGFEKVSDVELAGEAYERLTGVFGVRMRIIRMQLGDEHIELTQYLTPRGRPAPVDSRGNDRWFQHIAIVVSDMDRAYNHLRQHDVEHFSTGPQRLPDWNKNAAGIEAFYFRSPDDDILEIIRFPPGKGDPKWQNHGERLFLGIDHTAIVVADTNTSTRFYSSLLGLRLAGSSENYGTEQAHLNNVPGARLRITSLRAVGGPGVELLEYLSPRDGRPFDADHRANDLVHWQTDFRVADIRLAARTAGVASREVVTLPDDGLGFDQAVVLHDPDGHVVRLVDSRR
jgi:catechol 2,3-dioxygenase-like lactoylglutathione lyase family enzyme